MTHKISDIWGSCLAWARGIIRRKPKPVTFTVEEVEALFKRVNDYEAARRIEELSDEAGYWRKEAERLLQQYNRVVGRFNRLKSRVEGALNGA